MKKYGSVIFGLAMVLLALACSGKNSSGSRKDTLIVAVPAEPKSLNAQGANDSVSTNYKHQIYDTLLKQEDNGGISANLAEKWEYYDDVTLTITLRQGVKFHNGETLTANDVLFTIKRAVESEFTNWMVNVIDLEKSRVIDDYTLEIKLLEPSGPFLSQLCFLYVVNEKAVIEAGDRIEEHPIGTGPFVYKQWVRGDRIEFTTFKDYWGIIPPFDTMIMRVITEVSSRVIEIESSGVDVALRITASDIPTIERNATVKLVRGPSNSNNFIGFDCTLPPYNNKLVRQAISFAINKKDIVQAVYRGTGSIANGPLPQSVWGYNPNLFQYDYNPQRAKELLVQAGYPNGFDLLISTSDTQVRMDIAEIVQNQLSAVGINAKVEILENATYLDKIINGGFQLYILGWVINTGDADYGLYEPFHTGQPTWANTARYSNPQVDELLDQGKRIIDETERKAIYYKAQELIVDDAPWIFLWDTEEIAAVRSNINGLVSPPSGRYQFNLITFD